MWMARKRCMLWITAYSMWPSFQTLNQIITKSSTQTPRLMCILFFFWTISISVDSSVHLFVTNLSFSAWWRFWKLEVQIWGWDGRWKGEEYNTWAKRWSHPGFGHPWQSMQAVSCSVDQPSSRIHSEYSKRSSLISNKTSRLFTFISSFECIDRTVLFHKNRLRIICGSCLRRLFSHWIWLWNFWFQINSCSCSHRKFYLFTFISIKLAEKRNFIILKVVFYPFMGSFFIIHLGWSLKEIAVLLKTIVILICSIADI